MKEVLMTNLKKLKEIKWTAWIKEFDLKAFLKSFKTNRTNQLIAGWSLVALAVFSSFAYALSQMITPYREARSKAVTTAAEVARLVDYSDFTIYNGTETYFSVLGEDENHQMLYVLINDDTGEVSLFHQSEGVDKAKAEEVAIKNGAEKVSKVALGKDDNQVIWEVTAKNGIYQIQFDNGELKDTEGVV